mmetsp:Transcript_25354/g.22396  ORF Transcript_25354/g.22396 Transcript_25354/m.22396 type:complete len:85 (+) Transcript_25354:1533-1787(+)
MLKHQRRKNEFEEIIESSKMNDYEKFKLIRSNLDKVDEQTKLLENKIKFGKDSNQKDAERSSLDDHYFDSIRAKIAIINGFHDK